MIASMNDELRTKLERVRLMMVANNYGAVHIADLGNLSWILCGADMCVSLIDPPVAEVVITDKDITVLASSIEEHRLEEEELPDGVSSLYVPWYDDAKRQSILAELIGEGRVLSDDPGSGFEFRDFWALRVPLVEEEIRRYRSVCLDTSEVFTDVLLQTNSGVTELEIQGQLLEGLGSKGLQSVVLLVAGDERLERYKHPLPKNKLVQSRLMVVACTRKYGLIANLTRCVSFSGESLAKKTAYKDLLGVEAAILDHTQHGLLIRAAFDELKRAYAKAGDYDAWRAHHQGGPCGYNTRDFVAQPFGQQMIVDGSAYAWNPSLKGVKVEDTVLLRDGKLEMMTEDKRWPLSKVAGRLRPEVLEL